MTDDQSELLTAPSRYAYPQQPQQVLEELAVQLDLLPSCSFAFTGTCSRLALGLTSYRGRLLFRNGIADAVHESDEECEVNSSRDARSVLEVESGEVVEEGFEGGAGETMHR